MAITQQFENGTGSQTQYTLLFPYVAAEDVKVTIGGVLQDQDDPTEGYEIDGEILTFLTAPPAGTDNIKIYRETDIESLRATFFAGSQLKAEDLNLNFNQANYKNQETDNLVSDKWSKETATVYSTDAWDSDDDVVATTEAIDNRIDSKVDSALTTDVVAGDGLTITDNSPASGQITVGITNSGVTTAKIADSNVTTVKIADANITTAKIADSGVTTDKINNSAVTTAKIADSNVTTAKIADANVTTVKIADSNVTTAKIADGNVTTAKIADGNVTTIKVADSGITTDKIADSGVTTAKIADGNVTSSKVANSNITTEKIADSGITTAKIADSNVTTAKIADANVTTDKIADGAVTASKILDASISAEKLTDATIVTDAEQAASTPNDTSFFTTSAANTRFVNATGDTMSGVLNMGSNLISDVADPVNNSDAATKGWVASQIASGTVADATYGDIEVSNAGTTWELVAGAISNDDINSSAGIAVSKLADGTARQLLQTDAAGTGVEWTDNVDIPGTLDVTSTATFDGVISASAGAAATPSITFTGDTNTGIYSPGADQVAISTNGTGRLFIDSSGRAGLGTSTTRGLLTSQPSAGVTVAYDNTAGDAFFISNENITGGSGNFGGGITWGKPEALGVQRVASIASVQTAGDTDQCGLAFFTKASASNAADLQESLRVTHDGKVGIGISPDLTLHVQGDARFSGTTTAGSYLDIGPSNTGSDGVNIGVSYYGGGAYGPLKFKTSGLERARIDSLGRLLVGTSDDITGGTNYVIQSVFSSGAFIALGRNDGTVGAGDGIGGFQFYGNDGGSYESAAFIGAFADGTHLAGSKPGRLVFSTTANGAPSPTEAMRINSSGNVGIGSENPAHQLVVGQNAWIGTGGGESTGSGTSRTLTIAANRTTTNVSPSLQLLKGYTAASATVGGFKLELANTTVGSPELAFYSGTSTGNSSSSFVEPTWTEKARIDNSGRLLVGTPSAYDEYVGSNSGWNGGAYIAQNTGYGTLHLTDWDSGKDLYGGNNIFFSRCKSGTVGTHAGGALSNGNPIARLNFNASDGTNFRTAAWIEAAIDGTSGTADVPGRLVFSTTADGASSPTARLIIGNQGFVFPDQSSADNAGNYLSTSVGGFRWIAGSTTTTTRAESYANNTGTRYHQSFVNPNGTVGTISTNGSATAYNTSSDYRLKENLVPLTGAIDRLQQIPVHRFNFIANPGTVVDGFLAHEAQAVVPECVTGTKDEVDDEGNPVYQGIDQSKLVPLLTAALQEALQKIETLEQRLSDAGIA